ncbi:hypothetical protein EV681_0963 [Advenella incenata]|jgi:hypothetical protein|uniref:Uncharacterized protein n=1 Tax=Advenella incenata TaxID=267800 RepID=A0A4Q7VRN2_9BURK|nr:hypothetical protein EV681_0963 [Advenella incenata]
MGQASAKINARYWPRCFFEVYSGWIDGDANTRRRAKMDAYLEAIPSLTHHLELQSAEVA